MIYDFYSAHISLTFNDIPVWLSLNPINKYSLNFHFFSVLSCLPGQVGTPRISVIFLHSVGPRCPPAAPSVENLLLPRRRHSRDETKAEIKILTPKQQRQTGKWRWGMVERDWLLSCRFPTCSTSVLHATNFFMVTSMVQTLQQSTLRPTSLDIQAIISKQAYQPRYSGNNKQTGLTA